MASVKLVNPQAQSARKGVALALNINAAKGLQDVLKSNLGPKGTLKMLVGGAGDIKLTKDGCVLLHEMQIQHPTASLIARTATAQDDVTGDGTTSIVLLIGDMLKHAERYLVEGMHPAILVDGFELAKTEALKFLDSFKVRLTEDPSQVTPDGKCRLLDREMMVSTARTSLRTKLKPELADTLADIVVDSIQIIRRPGQELDLFMVEIMTMEHRMDTETTLVKGLVLDHGARHPDMKKDHKNCYVLTCNVSLEYEKSEIHSGFFYKSAEEREQLVTAERALTDQRVRDIIDLKNKVCGDDPTKSFVVINQKGIDPISLDMLAKAGIFALRRAKRRNMERLTLACGGVAVNSTEGLTPDVLGWADHVYEQVLGEEKYTFVEGVKNPLSCTILIRGPNKHTIRQVQDAIRDGHRAVKNLLEDKAVVPGAGAFELACHAHLLKYADLVSGKAKLGVRAFAEALLVIPKTLAVNSGFDPLDTLIKLQEAQQQGLVVGIDIHTGEPLDPLAEGILDNYRVKRQGLSSATFTTTQLLYVDEILKAGKQMKKVGEGEQ